MNTDANKFIRFGEKMSTISISAYYCRVCDAVSGFVKTFFAAGIHQFKIVALSRAAGELALAGYHEHAAQLVRDISRLNEEAEL